MDIAATASGSDTSRRFTAIRRRPSAPGRNPRQWVTQPQFGQKWKASPLPSPRVKAAVSPVT